MLPILPVLLLLLVNAPSKMDRVVGLRAICVLESLQRKLESGARFQPSSANEDTERAWASLLSLPLGPGDLERAFATLLGIEAGHIDPTPPDGGAERERSTPRRWDEPPSALAEGALECRRTRDGPVSR